MDTSTRRIPKTGTNNSLDDFVYVHSPRRVISKTRRDVVPGVKDFESMESLWSPKKERLSELGPRGPCRLFGESRGVCPVPGGFRYRHRWVTILCERKKNYTKSDPFLPYTTASLVICFSICEFICYQKTFYSSLSYVFTMKVVDLFSRLSGTQPVIGLGTR